MKCLVIMFALISLAAGSTVDETTFNSIQTNCTKLAGVSDVDKEEVKNNKTDTSKMKSMRACMLTQLGVMNEEGTKNNEVAIELLLNILSANVTITDHTEEVVRSAVTTCGCGEANSDLPEVASIYTKCLKKELEENNVLVNFL